MLQEKRFYLDQLKDGPVGHRHIMQRMSTRFNISATVIRDMLLSEGLIQMTHKKRIGSSQKYNYFYQLTKKKVVEKQQIMTHTIENCWPDGWPKSQNNAFNWRNKEQKLMSKREIVIAQQKYHNNNPITVYSRA